MALTFARSEDTTISIGSSVAQVISIDFSGVSADKVQVGPCLGEEVKQFRNGLAVDGGELTVSMLYTGSSHDAFVSDIKDGTEKAVTLTFKKGSTTIGTYSWSKGVVKSYKLGDIKDGANVSCEAVLYFNDLPTVGGGS